MYQNILRSIIVLPYPVSKYYKINHYLDFICILFINKTEDDWLLVDFLWICRLAFEVSKLYTVVIFLYILLIKLKLYFIFNLSTWIRIIMSSYVRKYAPSPLETLYCYWFCPKDFLWDQGVGYLWSGGSLLCKVFPVQIHLQICNYHRHYTIGCMSRGIF